MMNRLHAKISKKDIWTRHTACIPCHQIASSLQPVSIHHGLLLVLTLCIAVKPSGKVVEQSKHTKIQEKAT